MYVCVCVYECVDVGGRAQMWVGRHITVCVGGWITSITTTELVRCWRSSDISKSLLTKLMWVCASTSLRLFDFISKKLNETLQLTAAPLHYVQVGTQPSVCSIKDHFSVLQQHRGQQRLAFALIVAQSYLPVSFSFAVCPRGSRERHNGHSGISLCKKLTSPEGWGRPALCLPTDLQPETLGNKSTEGLSSVSYSKQFLCI